MLSYTIDMASPQFDTYLRLEDAKGKVLAENDDIAKDNQNSRILFTRAGRRRLPHRGHVVRGPGKR